MRIGANRGLSYVATRVRPSDLGTGATGAGDRFLSDDGTWVLASTDPQIEVIGFAIVNGNDIITTGIKGNRRMPFSGEVQEWVVISDSVSTIELDVKKSSVADYPATASIVGTDPPHLLAQSKNSNNVITDWDIISVGDIIEFEVVTNVDATSVYLYITIAKT